MAIYAQIMGNIVNLIGGKEVGLPNPNALCIDITDMENQVAENDVYHEGRFMKQEEYYKLISKENQES